VKFERERLLLSWGFGLGSKPETSTKKGNKAKSKKIPRFCPPPAKLHPMLADRNLCKLHSQNPLSNLWLSNRILVKK